jgi:hypothetical protein
LAYFSAYVDEIGSVGDFAKSSDQLLDFVKNERLMLTSCSRGEEWIDLVSSEPVQFGILDADHRFSEH